MDAGTLSLAELTVGVDIGGTFTDVVVVDARGGVRVGKVASTPPHYSTGVIEGLKKLGIPGSDIAHFAHGTTAAINAILTKSGAPTGLITTTGFRDILELRRADRGDLFNYWWRPPPPLVLRHNRLEVRERISFDGAIIEPLAEGDVVHAVNVFRARGVRSIAICFLNSFVNESHERRAKEIVCELWPDAHVWASIDIAPEILEFERTSTTVANAYVGPIMEGYLKDLLSELRSLGYSKEVFIMGSAGNVMTLDSAREVPIATAMSGIAAGAMAGASLSAAVGYPNLLTLDVGGTSSDIALIWGGKPRLTTEWFIEFGVPIKLPSVDIHTIGAGGGSLARVDVGDGLHVGPKSAGAVPGPACYGRGGTGATTTDAQLVLGRLDAGLWESVYGWPLDVSAAEQAIQHDVADPLGLSPVEAAEAVLDVTVNNLVEAIRLVSVQRGYDPRACALAAFGGAGPMYAVDVARALEIPEVIVPPAPGVTSALGLLQVDLAVRAQRSVLAREGQVHSAQIDRIFREMEEEAGAKLRRGGYHDIRITRQVDVRYFGQSGYITVDVPTSAWDEDVSRAVIAAFTAEHEREYGYVMPPHISQIEIANLRIVAEVKVRKADISVAASKGEHVGVRPVYFKGLGFQDVPVYQRASLSDSSVEGPAVIEQIDSTTVLPPGASARIAAAGNLIVRV